MCEGLQGVCWECAGSVLGVCWGCVGVFRGCAGSVRKLTLMETSSCSSSCSGMCTNWRGRSSPAAYPIKSSAVSRVCTDKLVPSDTVAHTNTSCHVYVLTPDVMSTLGRAVPQVSQFNKCSQRYQNSRQVGQPNTTNTKVISKAGYRSQNCACA